MLYPQKDRVSTVTPCPFHPFDPFGPLDPFAQGRMGQVGGSSVSSWRFKWAVQVGQMGQMKHAFFNAICLRLITTSLFDHVLLLNAVSFFIATLLFDHIPFLKLQLFFE